MAQVDWYLEVQKLIREGESVISIVTSGDIDSVVIHMFALSQYWPRNEDDSFKTPVYILLQKAKPDLYNITEVISRLEKRFGKFTKNIALSLAMGGNDFIPKFHLISHEKWITTILENSHYLQNIAKYENDETTSLITSASIETDIYLDIVKTLYCPANINPTSLDATRVCSKKMAKLVECQLQYLATVWKHDANLPNFLEKGCLVKDSDGNVGYNFGENIKVSDPKEMLELSEDAIKSLMKTAKNRPRSNHGTPTKQRKSKCRPKMSTPRKDKQKKFDDMTED
ncbi:Hypothetical predicted protein [Mytilus galloprovincialis]|uniref:Uncharacterized protein n=1 Tax=Mytilus galloprovincialis TaxID=29158 RepID=A0A8B6DU93_MYTGA|nr:Hypothetical predicted protein [Mytilus galloprovincialis]